MGLLLLMGADTKNTEISRQLVHYTLLGWTAKAQYTFNAFIICNAGVVVFIALPLIQL